MLARCSVQKMNIRICVFSGYFTRTGGWFRLFGVGVVWKNLDHHRLCFSERNGFKKHFEIGRWSFAWLS